MPKNTEKFISKRAIPGVTLTPCDGYYKVRKIGLTGERVKKDPVFHNTRKQANEFGAIITWSRQVTNHLLSETKIKGARQRFTGALVKAIYTDTVNAFGERKLCDGDWKTLIGFEFNEAAAWRDTVLAESKTRYNHNTDEIEYALPAWVPAEQVQAPPEVTHYRIKATVVTITAGHEVQCLPWQQSTMVPRKKIRMPAIKMKFKVQKMESALHMVVVYIQWYVQDSSSGKINKSKMPGAMCIMDICRYI